MVKFSVVPAGSYLSLFILKTNFMFERPVLMALYFQLFSVDMVI